ncbi:MAG: SBBP repeat-containing protein, partial [Candidatus Thermoplasmatota archaeon]|nr:SBBP repeat-containing protein [Candidatus Thermoplasmatota archaeon]
MFRKMPFLTIFLMVTLLLLPAARPARSQHEEVMETEGPVMESDTSLSGTGSFFVENKGQWPDEITHTAQTSFGQVGIGMNSLYFHLMSENGIDDVVRYNFQDSLDAVIISRDRVPGIFNYLIGDRSDWATGARQYRSIELESVWNGVDLRMRSEDQGSKYEFILEPYADPGTISISIDGAVKVEAVDDALLIETSSGRILEDSGLTVFYQDDPDDVIDARYRVDDLTFTIEPGKYDRSRSIVIDPLVRSTYFGGSSTDEIRNMVTDDEKYVYFTGHTYSINFPVTPGCYDSSHNSGTDAFVSKM